MTIDVSSHTALKESWLSPAISAAMRCLEKIAAEIGPTNIPVLLFGEIGTGKQAFARRIHQLSEQAEHRFRTISCASINSATFYSELELGTTDEDRRGQEGMAPGTLFFDEINELDAACQRNLLYALPDGETALRPGLLAGRVIAATTRNLDEEMQAGRFRMELYYRTNG